MPLSLNHEGKKIVRIADEKDFIDQDGRLKCDLFNDKGAILAKEGQKAPAKIHSVPVYTYVSAYEKFSKLPEVDVNTTCEMENLDNLLSKKKIAKEKVGVEAFKTYENTSDHLESFFRKGPEARMDWETALDIVEENFKQDSSALYECVRSIRTSDSYTAHHSYSVFLLFIDAMHEFKKHIDRDDFWDTFKDSYATVSFNDTAIKTYAAGALMHDLGKAYIPPEILNKRGELTEQEFQIMKKHPRLGVEALLRNNIRNKQIHEMVANHHVRYPVFVEQGQSSLTVITNIIDIFDACTSQRCYKPAFTWEETLAVLEKERAYANWNPFIYQTLVHKVLANRI